MISLGAIGVEPTTSAMSRQRSNQLSYAPRAAYLTTGLRAIQSNRPSLDVFFADNGLAVLAARRKACNGAR